MDEQAGLVLESGHEANGMTDQPLVSIIVINFNYARYLRDAINSALNQTYSNIEVIVTDDGSTDDSREIIGSYGTAVTPILKENGGGASALNAGFAASTGTIILLLDSDDIFKPHKVERVVDILKRHQDVGSCFHALQAVDDTGAELPRTTRMACVGEHDFRLGARKGRMPLIATATSGLCFRRSLLARIFPLPEMKSIPANDDRYLKWTALCLQPTFFTDDKLASQRLHRANWYTSKNNRQSKAELSISTAYWMKRDFPEVLTPWANRVFAEGLGMRWRSGSCRAEVRTMAATYLSSVSLRARIEIVLRALYAWGTS